MLEAPSLIKLNYSDQVIIVSLFQVLHYVTKNICAELTVIYIFRVHQRHQNKKLLEKFITLEVRHVIYNVFAQFQRDMVETERLCTPFKAISRELVAEDYCCQLPHWVVLPLI